MSSQESDIYVAIGPIMRAPLIGGGFGVITGTATLTKSGFDLVVRKRYRGTSPDFDVKKYLCGACGEDYERCEHRNANLIPTGIYPRSVSITRHPRMGTKITDVLCIKTRRNHRHYRWFGFRDGSASRQQNIDEMYQERYLSETAMNYVTKYFASRKSGDCKYTENIVG